jgi:hypothetical protein
MVLFEEWEKLDMDVINKVLLTMPAQFAAVKEAKGGGVRW